MVPLSGSRGIALLSGVWVVLSVTMTAAGDRAYFFHNDHLGTPQAMTDLAGRTVWTAEYEPFGKVAVDQDPDGDGQQVVNNLRFPGQYYDAETGLHYNYHRDYDPETGRYLQPDPIGLKGGTNLYAYAGDNPIGSFDPLGLDFTNIGSRLVWVLIDRSWKPVSPGATEYGETDAAVSVPEKKEGDCPKKCKAFKWIDCYDAMGEGFSDGSLMVKLLFCGEKHMEGKPRRRKLVCTNPGTAAIGQAVRGGWVDPLAEFHSAPPGCSQ